MNSLWKIMLIFFISANVYADIVISETVIGESSNIHVNGNWTNNGIFTANSSAVIFDGTATQTIGGINTTTFSGVTINNSTGITLDIAINVSGVLTLTSGNITSTVGSILTLSSSASISGGNISSFISGPMKHTIAATASTEKAFPLGKVTAYRPLILTITQDAVTSTEYTAEVFNTAPNSRTLAGTLEKVSIVRYWNVVKGTGASITNGSVQLNYDSDDGVNDYLNLRIAKDDGSGNWIDIGGTGTANTAGSITSTTNFTSLGDFTLANAIGGDNSLPVTLSAFSALKEENAVLLQWTTESEINNLAFILERGENNQNFAQIAEIEGQGNCSYRSEYEYRDSQVISGNTYYYRLSDLDLSGQITIHKIISVKIQESIPERFTLYQNYPNPFNPGTTIPFDIQGERGVPVNIRISIYNMLGQFVQTLYEGKLIPGAHKLFWYASDSNGTLLPTGVYVVNMQVPGSVTNKKIVLIK